MPEVPIFRPPLIPVNASGQPRFFYDDGHDHRSWQEVVAGVTSVNGRGGVVVLTAADVGLANVDNTSDANKPVGTATQTALNLKLTRSANLSDLTSTPTARTNLGLAVVAASGSYADLTGKPDLSVYATLASPTFTGTPAGPTPSLADNSTRFATTAYVQAVAASHTHPSADISDSSAVGRAVLKAADAAAARTVIGAGVGDTVKAAANIFSQPQSVTSAGRSALALTVDPSGTWDGTPAIDIIASATANVATRAFRAGNGNFIVDILPSTAANLYINGGVGEAIRVAGGSTYLGGGVVAISPDVNTAGLTVRTVASQVAPAVRVRNAGDTADLASIGADGTGTFTGLTNVRSASSAVNGSPIFAARSRLSDGRSAFTAFDNQGIGTPQLIVGTPKYDGSDGFETDGAVFAPNTLQMNSGFVFGWTDTTSYGGMVNTSFGRISAGVIGSTTTGASFYSLAAGAGGIATSGEGRFKSLLLGDAGISGYAGFKHYTSPDFALISSSDGATILNSATGYPLSLRTGNADALVIQANSVLFVPNAGSEPSGNPTGGSWLYSFGGQLKAKSTSGVTTPLDRDVGSTRVRSDKLAVGGVLTTAADGATVTFDLNASNLQQVTLGGNRTLALSNDADSDRFTIILRQDATGARSVTFWSGILWASGVTPTLTTTANKRDVFSFVRLASGVYLGFTALNF